MEPPKAPNPPGAYVGPANRDQPSRPGVGHMGGKGGPPPPPGGPAFPPHQLGGPGSGPGKAPQQQQQQAPGSYPGPVNSVKAQQLAQRQELLNHAKKFLQAPPPPAPKAPEAKEDLKPALAMVAHPSLVGTSVTINLSASSNTRAPAVPTTSPPTTASAASAPPDGDAAGEGPATGAEPSQ